jgi:hypothetical protein
MPTRSKGRLMRCTVLDDANSSRFSAAARSPGRSERARRNRKRLLELAIYRPRTPRPHVSGLTLKESPARAGSFLGDFADAKGASSKPDSAQIPKRGFFYGAAFTHTMTRGLVPAILRHVTVLSLIKVTGILRGPQYPITSTSFWLHSPLHAAAVQSKRITRMAFSAAPGGPAGPSAP